MIRQFLLALLMSLTFTAHAQAIKTVYHVNTGIESAAAVLNYVRNHLDTDPTAKIVVVTHADGIDFLIQDAKDSKGR